MKTLTTPTASKSAFTLLEMLAVITILGFLIGICTPSILDARANTQNAVNQATTDTITKGIMRAKLDSPAEIPVLNGNDVVAAAAWLVDNGYIVLR